MKAILSSFILFLTIAATAQNEIVLHINHLMGSQPFELNTAVAAPGNYEIKYIRMEYYLSDFVITHDGGQETFLTDTHLLVNADGTSDYSLGSWDIDVIEGITFAVGVDEDHNHLDPATYPMGHPLAPQFPSMHWGWASGYRFVAAEGTSGNNFTADWQIHALGDQNFFDQSHAVSASAEGGQADIWLDADYNNMFIQLNVSNGLIEHSDTNEAIDLLENMQQNVFSVGQPVGVANTSALEVAAFPVPANEVLYVTSNQPGAALELLDISGRMVLSQQFTTSRLVINTTELPAGIYFARVSEGNEVTTQRVMIRH